MANIKADILIRAGKIHTLQPGVPMKRSLAILGQHIFSISENYNDLNHLIGPKTRLINEPDSTVLPAFDDTHTHLMLAGQMQFDVPVHNANNIQEVLDLIRQRASTSEPGAWIFTTTNWQEFNLPEKRFPTIQELDEISSQHPIIVRRGGHNMVANSCALAYAGITKDTKPPPGGEIGKDENGEMTGLIQDSAVALIYKVQPPIEAETRIRGLEGASASYASTGIGCVRDCWVPIEDVPILQAAYDAGKLQTRFRGLISAIGLSSVDEVSQLLDQMEQWRHLQNHPWLSIWGVKFMLDGGIESGAMEEPYVSEGCGCNSPTDYRGRLLWDPEQMIAALDIVIRRGWRIGTHALGDRAVRIILDVYTELARRHPNMPPGTLVIEHGGLATAEQRARAAAINASVTIQLPLLHDIAGISEVYYGRDRVSRVFPVRQWLDSGVLTTAGSDFPVGRYGAMYSLQGLTTRKTVIGVLGEEHAISLPEAIDLHTTTAAKFLGESNLRGMLTPGRYADLTIWRRDPFEMETVSEVQDAQTMYTIVGGQIKHQYV
ncbi:exoenzymes regulatory aepa precursor [Trichoderma arundinaceum]|uniref:Exoenzymes regulatory aepa n=1 Tax=Trichoderma arundinaceum TaxID=490622 RepID=A0A395P0S1_TRIAR|nr:exoenzymes regulatory aepa precursor [Trichoderma arundinaceum]